MERFIFNAIRDHVFCVDAYEHNCDIEDQLQENHLPVMYRFT